MIHVFSYQYSLYPLQNYLMDSTKHFIHSSTAWTIIVGISVVFSIFFSEPAILLWIISWLPTKL
jgi:hypothetical protein